MARPVLVAALFALAAGAETINPLDMRWTFGAHEPITMYRRKGVRTTGGIEGSSKWVASWLDWFDTESPKYCILSDVVPGGIKVGTKLSDLEKFNFSKTRYGRNKPGNELKLDKGQPSDPSDKRYTIYGLEYCRINLRIKNGVVTGWQFLTAENDYEVNYDKSISFF